MAFTPFNGSGGGGSGSDDCTGYKSQALAGYTFITHESDDEAVQGTIPTYNNSGNTVLKSDTTSKSYAAGYYPNAHGAQINVQTKSVAPSTSAQTVSPDSGKVLTAVTVSAIPNQKAAATYTPSTSAQSIASGQWLAGAQTIAAIPNQKSDSGYVTLNTGTRSKNYSAGWYNNEHGAQINTQGKNVTPSTSAQTVTPDTNYVLSSVSVAAIPNQKAAATYTPSTSAQSIASGQWLAGAQTIAAIPNQTAGGTVTLTASNTSASRSAGSYLTSAFNVNISPQSKSFTPTASGATITPDSGNVLSSVTVAGDSNLVASNILYGKSIFGVSGTVRQFGSHIYGNSDLGSFTYSGTSSVTNWATTGSMTVYRYDFATSLPFYPYMLSLISLYSYTFSNFSRYDGAFWSTTGNASTAFQALPDGCSFEKTACTVILVAEHSPTNHRAIVAGYY